MALLLQHTDAWLLYLSILLCMSTSLVSSHSRHYTAPTVPRLTDQFSHVSVDQGLSNFFGEHNIKLINNGSMATLALDKTSGELYIIQVLFFGLIFTEN